MELNTINGATLRTLMLALYLFVLTLPAMANDESWIDVQVEGHGPAIILIPGLASSRDVWATTAAHLKANHQVYLVQVKGFAGLPAAPGMNKAGLMGGLVDALADYIEKNKLDHPAIIGHSMGGYLALRLERDYPHLVGGTLIVDALPFYSALINPQANAQNMKPMAAGFKAQIIAGAGLDPASRRAATAQTIASLVNGKDDIAMAVNWSLNSDPAVVGEAVAELMTSDLRTDLAAMTTPTTILAAWAPGGPYSKAQTGGFWRHQYAAHKTATVHVVEGTRHFIMLDQPAAFLDQVDIFLVNNKTHLRTGRAVGGV